MAKNLITMTRSGEFSIMVHGDSHCSTAPDGQKTAIRYDVAFVCEPKFNARGFLVDQLTVGQFFLDQTSTRLSCEELVADYAEQLYHIAMAENPGGKIHVVEVTLAPAPFGAKMIYRREGPMAPALAKAISKKR